LLLECCHLRLQLKHVWTLLIVVTPVVSRHLLNRREVILNCYYILLLLIIIMIINLHRRFATQSWRNLLVQYILPTHQHTSLSLSLSLCLSLSANCYWFYRRIKGCSYYSVTRSSGGSESVRRQVRPPRPESSRCYGEVERRWMPSFIQPTSVHWTTPLTTRFSSSLLVVVACSPPSPTNQPNNQLSSCPSVPLLA